MTGKTNQNNSVKFSEMLKLAKILFRIFIFYLIISLALEIEKSGWATNRCRKIVFKGYRGKTNPKHEADPNRMFYQYRIIKDTSLCLL